MDKTIADVIMNPVRQRIAQYLLVHGSGTVGDMAREMTDVPRPSLYRHIKVMLDAGCIEVTDSKAVRGAVEKTYALVKNIIKDPTNSEIGLFIQSILLNIAGSFASYFQDESADPRKDMLSVSASTLLLSDEEFMEMLGKIGSVFNDYIGNKPNEDRKQRRLTIISSPADGEEK